MDKKIIHNIAYAMFFILGYVAGSYEENWMPLWVYILGFIGAFVLIKVIENRPEVKNGSTGSE